MCQNPERHDPSLLRDRTTTPAVWYMYCTMDPVSHKERDGKGWKFRMMPVYRSVDLVNWYFVRDSFDKRPPGIEHGAQHAGVLVGDAFGRVEDAGLVVSARTPTESLCEIMELPRTGDNAHPWYVGVQYHPELRSTVLNPHPLFVKFVDAALNHKRSIS